MSFVLSFFPRGVLDEILNLIESVSEGFPSYSFRFVSKMDRNILFSVQSWSGNVWNDESIDAAANQNHASRLRMFHSVRGYSSGFTPI